MKTILVVEDDPYTALLFRKVLERRGGFNIVVTESADEIMSLVRGGSVGLIIMDVSLAHTTWEGRPVNGIDLCRAIKSSSDTQHVPVVLATAHAMRGDAERFQAQSGADGYVSKPILDQAVFADQIARLLREAA
jgi:two-component system cell cycle response regulator DivK